MRILLVYAGLHEELHDWPDRRSLALQRIAGGNVLGHVLQQLKEIEASEILLLTDRDDQQIADWFAENLPQTAAHVIPTAPAANPLHALAHCPLCFDHQPLLLVLGSCITEADYKDLQKGDADITLYRPPIFAPDLEPTSAGKPLWAGVSYFRQGTILRDALSLARHDSVADFDAFLNRLAGQELRIDQRRADLCLDTHTVEGLLLANARLLGLGYGSEDAIERSYAEDFTVLPPVFLHQSAVIENSVIGPFVNLEAGSVVRGSVVGNTLIGANSRIENAVLDGSLIGESAHVRAQAHVLRVDSASETMLDARPVH